MSKRTLAAVVAVVVVGLVLWWWRGHRAPTASRPAAATARPSGDPRGGAPVRGLASDPRGLARASIAGVVREADGAPIAGAQVCTAWSGKGITDDDGHEPRCARSDATGAYLLDELVPATHRPAASAPGHLPRVWLDPRDRRPRLELAAGERKAGVDFVLERGGVPVSGVVEDVSGGPVAGAVVGVHGQRYWGALTSITHTDDAGRFTVWTEPGTVTIAASAEGYTDGTAQAAAPAARVTLYLTPESTLAGVVVTADDRRPVAGAIVDAQAWMSGAGSATTRTDDAGRFRLTRLAPGRYKPTATGDGWYGEPRESVLLGLGQSVDGVEIVVAAAFAVRGQVLIDGAPPTPCADGDVWLTDRATGRDASAELLADGSFAATAVRPGHYVARVRCVGYVPRDRYDPIDVVDRDVTGVALAVAAGAALRGTITTSAGAPVVDAQVSVRTKAGDPRAQRVDGNATSGPDGGYVVRGLLPGTYTVTVWATAARQAAPPPVATVPPTGDGVLDVVLPASGEIGGTVVDTAGAPVVGARVSSTATSWSFGNDALTGDDGTFVLRAVEPGVRRVTARRGWLDELRRPGTTDDDRQGEAVTVVAGRRATVRLVVEAEDGVIAGAVRDDRGQPVGDAWISATRESDAAGAAAGDAQRVGRWAWGGGQRPVVTGVDGTFAIAQLAAGAYTLRAFRKGGGEAVAEHVAVGTRDARLTIATTGSVVGTVVTADGRPLDEFSVALEDEVTGFSRSETFYRTDGGFALRELPAGRFVATARAAGARVQTTLELAGGEHKAGVVFTLTPNLRVVGRFVDLDSGAPVAGLRAFASPVKGDDAGSFFGAGAEDRRDISGPDGRFVVVDAPIGLAQVGGRQVDRTGPYALSRWVVELGAGPEVDVGDIPVVKRRMQPGDEAGSFGMTFVDPAPDADPRARALSVSHLDPGGPAVRAGVAVGDLVTTIDGHDIRGPATSLIGPLLRVKVGTAVRFGLARGVEVTLTAVADQ